MRITELYKIVEGSTEYYFTSSDSDIVYDGDTYISTAINRSEPENKSDLAKANLDISLSIDHELSQKYLESIVDTVVSLTLFTREDSAVSVAWKGRLASIKPEGPILKLIFESLYTSLRRPGLSERFQRNCRHVLYGRGCKVDKSAFEVSSTATAANGSIVTCPGATSYPENYFLGGMLKAPDGTLRFIVSHVGNQITLVRAIDSLSKAISVGTQNVKLYPGCDRTRIMCQNRFNNIPNNGSYPFIPTRNPFGGSSFA